MTVSPLRVAITISAVMRGARAFSEAEGRIKGLVGSLKAMRVQLELLAAWHAYDFMRQTVQVFAAVQDQAYMTTAMLYKQGMAFDDIKNEADNLTLSLMKLSTQYPKSPDDIGAGYYKLVSSGIRDYTEALEQMDTILKFSTVGYTSVNNATIVGIKAMAAYKMEVSDLPEIYDTIYTAANDAVATVDEFSSALTKVMPAAGRAGESLETTTATLSFLTQAFKDAEVAGTAYRRMIMQFQKMGTIKKLEDLGFTVMTNKEYIGAAADKVNVYNNQIDMLNDSIDVFTKNLQDYLKNNKDVDEEYGSIIDSGISYNEMMQVLQTQYEINTAESYKYEEALKSLREEILRTQVDIEAVNIDIQRNAGVMTVSRLNDLRRLTIEQMEQKKSIDETRLAQKEYLDQSRGLADLIDLLKPIAKAENDINKTYDALDKITVSFANLRKPSEVVKDMVIKFKEMSASQQEASLTAIGFADSMSRITAQQAILALTTQQIEGLKNGTLTLEDVFKDVGESAGSVDRAFSLVSITMNNKMRVAINKMIEAFTPFAASVSNLFVSLTPMINIFAQSINKVADILKVFIDAFTFLINLGGGKGGEVLAYLIALFITWKIVVATFTPVLAMYNNYVSIKNALHEKDITISRLKIALEKRNLTLASLRNSRLGVYLGLSNAKAVSDAKNLAISQSKTTAIQAEATAIDISTVSTQMNVVAEEEANAHRTAALLILSLMKKETEENNAAIITNTVEIYGNEAAIMQSSTAEELFTFAKKLDTEITKENTFQTKVNSLSINQRIKNIIKSIHASKRKIAADKMEIKQLNKQTFSNYKAAISEKTHSLATKISTIATNIYTKSINRLKTVKSRLTIENIKNSLSTLKNTIATKLATLATKQYWIELWASVKTKIKNTFATIANTIAKVANTIATYAAAAGLILYEAVTWLVTAATWAWNAALYANPLVFIVMVILAVILAIVWLYKNIDKVTDATKNLGKWLLWLIQILFIVPITIAKVLSWVFEKLSSWFNNSGRDMAWNFITGFVDKLKSAGQWIKNSLMDIIGFDVPKNDRMAQKWGKDMAYHFSLGASEGFRFGYSPVPLAMGAASGGDNINITIHAQTNASADDIADSVSRAIVNQKKRRYGGY